MNFVGDKIKKYRKEHGLSQKELGDKMNVSQAMIAQYENGKRTPKMETLKKIASALDISINSLVDYVLLGDSFVPQYCVEDENYKPLLKTLENEHKINSKSNDNVLLPLADSINQVYQNKLLDSFNKLNGIGKEKAIERVEELTEIKKYTEQKE